MTDRKMNTWLDYQASTSQIGKESDADTSYS